MFSYFMTQFTQVVENFAPNDMLKIHTIVEASSHT